MEEHVNQRESLMPTLTSDLVPVELLFHPFLETLLAQCSYQPFQNKPNLFC